MDEVTLHRAKIDDTGYFIGLKVNTDGRLATQMTLDKLQAAVYSLDDWKELMAWLAPNVKYQLEPLEGPAPEPLQATCITTAEELARQLGTSWIPEGITTAEELTRKSGIGWRIERRIIDEPEPEPELELEPEPVDTVSKDKALELFLDAIHIGFESNHNKSFNRLEAVHYFSERLKEL